MLTLDEAIKHCEEKAKELKKDYERAVALNIPSEGCLECANEHEQLAEWLKELKRYRETDYLRHQYEKYIDTQKNDSSPLKADLVSYCKGLEDGRKLGDKE